MLFKLIVASILTGLISGFFITFYELLVTFLTYFFFKGNPFETIPNLPTWYIYMVPTVSIFFINYLTSKDKYIREYGVNEIADSIIKNEMILSIKTLFLKILASALSLASGFAVGTEGPSAGIGAMIAYHIHRIFKLPTMLIKMMISVGASSGIAAIFVSPITGMAFAVENIAHQFIKQYVGYLILASVLSFGVAIQFLEPVFFQHSSGRKLDLDYIVPMLLFIPFITFFIYFYLFLKKKILHFIDLELFKKFHKWRNYIFALIGGGTIGTILLLNPHAGFAGKYVVEYLINDETHISIMLILTVLILRIVATTVSIYANAVGGIFLPLMSIGAMTGFMYVELLTKFYHFQVEPFYFAAIGAAVFMGVLMKLPLTAVILAMETTFDYNVVVATGIIVVLVSYLSGLSFKIKKRYITEADEIVLDEKEKEKAT